MAPDIDAVSTIEQSANRIIEIASSADLTTPTMLGRWKLRDLLAHLAGVHEWATRIVETRSMDGPGARKLKVPDESLLN